MFSSSIALFFLCSSSVFLLLQWCSSSCCIYTSYFWHDSVCSFPVQSFLLIRNNLTSTDSFVFFVLQSSYISAIIVTWLLALLTALLWLTRFIQDRVHYDRTFFVIMVSATFCDRRISRGYCDAHVCLHITAIQKYFGKTTIDNLLKTHYNYFFFISVFPIHFSSYRTSLLFRHCL